MIPIAIPNLDGNERQYLNQCIDDGFVSTVGQFVGQFEDQLCAYTAAKHSVVVSSGTSALHLALLSVGTGPNDLVIIPSFTFIATANAVSHTGAKPWIFDVSEKDWGLDLQLLEQTLSTATYQEGSQLFHKETKQRVAAIVPVYSMGLPCDHDALKKISKEFNVPVVVDAAAGIGSLYQGNPLGQHGGDATIVSFNGNKNITSGGGGAILTNNDNLADFVRHVSTTARQGPNYDHDLVGFNLRMTNIEAAVGCAQLERAAEFLNKKKKIRQFYDECFTGIANIRPFPSIEGRESSYWLSGLLLEKYNITNMIDKLRAQNIEARLFWKPIHLQKPYEDCLQTPQDVSSEIWDKVLTLPCSTSITDEDLEYVCDVVKNALEHGHTG